MVARFSLGTTQQLATLGLQNLKAKKAVLTYVKRRHAAFASVAAFATGALIFTHLGAPVASQETPDPLILEKVQALGQLHTVRHTSQQVFEQQTSRPVADWATYIPGAASLVKSVTSNSALVSIRSEVEAGVDLSKAKLVGQTLVLPKPQIYSPVTYGHAYQHKSGLLWRDDNIDYSAEAVARQNAINAAQREGILKQASHQAVERVTQLVKSLGSKVCVSIES